MIQLIIKMGVKTEENRKSGLFDYSHPFENLIYVRSVVTKVRKDSYA